MKYRVIIDGPDGTDITTYTSIIPVVAILAQQPAGVTVTIEIED